MPPTPLFHSERVIASYGECESYGNKNQTHGFEKQQQKLYKVEGLGKEGSYSDEGFEKLIIVAANDPVPIAQRGVHPLLERRRRTERDQADREVRFAECGLRKRDHHCVIIGRASVVPEPYGQVGGSVARELQNDGWGRVLVASTEGL